MKCINDFFFCKYASISILSYLTLEHISKKFEERRYTDAVSVYPFHFIKHIKKIKETMHQSLEFCPRMLLFCDPYLRLPLKTQDKSSPGSPWRSPSKSIINKGSNCKVTNEI